MIVSAGPSIEVITEALEGLAELSSYIKDDVAGVDGGFSIAVIIVTVGIYSSKGIAALIYIVI